MRRVLINLVGFAALTLVAACATKNLSPVDPGVQTVRISSPSGSLNLRVRQDDYASEQVVGFPVDVVWRAMPAVFDSLGVTVDKVDPATKLIGAEAFKLRKSLRGVPLSRYFDCGTTQIGANADSYEIVLTLLTRVSPAPANMSTVEVTVLAQARPVAFRQNYMTCDPRGTLTAKFVATLREIAAR